MSERKKKPEGGSPKTGVKNQEPRIKKSEVNSPMLPFDKLRAGSAQYDKENPTIKEKLTTDHSQFTTTMEVHHHPDLHHKPKPWKEYLLEYLMIFLAVMTGFFAESLREHLGDKNKEKEYLTSLVAELRADTIHYNKCLADIVKMRPNLDSLFANASHPERYNYVIQGKWNTPVNENGVSYMPTLSSIQQLKSSGNLRLISDKEIALETITYETYIDGEYRHHFAAIDAASERLYGLEDVICDETEFNNKVNKNIINNTDNDDQQQTGIFDMPIKIRDNAQLNQLANSVVNYNSRCWGYMTAIKRAKGMARMLINDIQKEYKLENE